MVKWDGEVQWDGEVGWLTGTTSNSLGGQKNTQYTIYNLNYLSFLIQQNIL